MEDLGVLTIAMKMKVTGKIVHSNSRLSCFIMFISSNIYIILY